MKKKISQILILMSIAGIAMLFVMGIKLSKKSMFELIKGRRTQNDELVVNLELNDMVPGTDAYMHRYTFPVRTEDEGKCIFLYAEAWDSEGNPLQTVIDDTKKNQCVEVSFDKEVELLVYSDKEYYEGTIRFTNLPVLSIYTYDGDVDEKYRMHFYSKSYIIDPYFDADKSEYYIESKAEHFKRGSTAYRFPKASYKFSLKKINKDKERVNRSKQLLGMRDDDDWVLDAAYTDPSRIRNKLASDLWNVITDSSSSQYRYYLNSEYVELYIDSSFQGLYVLKEPADWKTANLTDGDFLVKATQKTSVTQGMINHSYENIKEWNGYELEYPDTDNYVYYWQKLMTLYDEINNDSLEKLSDYFDVDNMIDYYILLNITSANDNSWKNVLFNYDSSNKKLSVIPWDIDLSFGLHYDDLSELLSQKRMNEFQDIHTFYPFSRLESNDSRTKELIKKRWEELRDSSLSDENILKLIDEHLQVLSAGDILNKEASRWTFLDYKSEIEEIRQWLTKRIQFLDEYFMN